MPGGTALPNFKDFITTTGPSYLTGAEQVLNEAQKRKYTIAMLLRGKGRDRVMQGGEEIKDVIMFDDASTYDHFKPGKTFTWQSPSVLQEWSIPWRFSIDHMAWNETTVRLNTNRKLVRSEIIARYKRLKKTIEMRMWTSMWNGMENDLWASPHGASTFSEMEGKQGELPYSIPAFLNEETNGLPNGWTTIQGIDPASEPRWRPVRVQYNANDLHDTGGNFTGLFDAFDRAMQEVDYTPPDVPVGKDAFEQRMMNGLLCFTSDRGERWYKRLLRDSNDTLVSQQDPAYNRPMNAGMAIRGIPQLNDAALYNGSGTYVSEMLASAPGPRFYIINSEYLCPIWHDEAYMERLEPKQPSNQVDTWVVPVLNFWNLTCRARSRQAIIYPGA